jgi:hypothetical protein
MVQILERRSKIELEDLINDFAKENNIKSISLSTCVVPKIGQILDWTWTDVLYTAVITYTPINQTSLLNG